MNQTELTRRVAEDAEVSDGTAEAVLRALARQVQEAVARGERVQVGGLFIAEAAQRAERGGRNPRTGEAITIPAHRAVRITPAAALKHAASR